MKSSVVYLSVSGNTRRLADEIVKAAGECAYVGKPDDAALVADRVYVGFWTAKFSCPPEIAAFLEKLENKEVFLFGTAGYDNTPGFFNGILDSAAAHVGPSNRITGRFMCQGQVSDGKKKALETTDAEKYRRMQPKLLQGDGHPDEADMQALRAVLKDL